MPVYNDKFPCARRRHDQATMHILTLYSFPTHIVNCTHGDVRLVGGNTAFEGRVEICTSNDTWSTICDDLWGTPDANVVCRQLGYSGTGMYYFKSYCTVFLALLQCYTISGATARCCAAFGQGTGLIVLDDVQCSGTESTLLSCPARQIGTHNCGHYEDAGVVCLPPPTSKPSSPSTKKF